MEKEDFEKMNPKEKANYIKNNLNQGVSFKEIYDATMQDNELVKSKEALLNQFKKAGYPMPPKTSDYRKNHISAPQATDDSLPISIKNDRQEYEKLLQASDDIMQMLIWWKNNHCDQIAIDDRLSISVPQEGEDVRKSLRINVQVWKEWKSFCRKYPWFKEKDLLAKALLFYMEKGH